MGTNSMLEGSRLYVRATCIFILQTSRAAFAQALPLPCRIARSTDLTLSHEFIAWFASLRFRFIRDEQHTQKKVIKFISSLCLFCQYFALDVQFHFHFVLGSASLIVSTGYIFQRINCHYYVCSINDGRFYHQNANTPNGSPESFSHGSHERNIQMRCRWVSDRFFIYSI